MQRACRHALPPRVRRVCVSAQDPAILNSPPKVKKFLEEEGIAYDPGTTKFTLRGMANVARPHAHQAFGGMA